MTAKLLAIGLDGADPMLVNRWCDEGHLPTLAGLRAKSRYVELKNIDCYRAEIPWTTFLTGVAPDATGYWGRIQYDAEQFTVDEGGAYDFQEYPPFYALNKDKKVCVFDMPQTRLQPAQQGVEVLAWGAHSPRGPSVSKPAELFNELVDTYGEHPRLNNDHANIYDAQATRQLRDDFLLGIERRTRIAVDLLARDAWDLFLMMYSETHSAGHTFWHMDQCHPLNGKLGDGQDNFQLEIFKAVDASLSRLLADQGDANIVLFSAHGMVHNVLDVASMLILPEFCYRRYVNPAGILAQPNGDALHGDYPEHWSQELWQRRNMLSPQIDSPDDQRARGLSLAWQAANWYQPQWPKMRAFALPSYSDGYIRMNVRGRDKYGVASAEEYAEEIQALEQSLMALRTVDGTPVVRRIIRTRDDAFDFDPKLPDADLIVCWREGKAFDALTHPQFGTFGPVPYFRTGGHRNHGFAFFRGPEISLGELGVESALRLTPSILELMQVDVPAYMAPPLDF